MEEKTKRLILFIGSLFVAIIFVTSYLAFGSNATNSSTTTSAPSGNTVLVYGSANGIVMNYSYSAYITMANRSRLDALNSTLDMLEANGTISNYVPVNGTTYEAILSTINLYQLSAYLSNSPAVGASVGGYTYVALPANVPMHYGTGSKVEISFPPKNYTIYLSRVYPIGSAVPLQIQALVTMQGTIFNNQVRLTEGQ